MAPSPLARSSVVYVPNQRDGWWITTLSSVAAPLHTRGEASPEINGAPSPVVQCNARPVNLSFELSRGETLSDSGWNGWKRCVRLPLAGVQAVYSSHIIRQANDLRLAAGGSGQDWIVVSV